MFETPKTPPAENIYPNGIPFKPIEESSAKKFFKKWTDKSSVSKLFPNVFYVLFAILIVLGLLTINVNGSAKPKTIENINQEINANSKAWVYKQGQIDENILTIIKKENRNKTLRAEQDALNTNNEELRNSIEMLKNKKSVLKKN